MTSWKTYRLGKIVATNKKSIGRSYPFSMIKYLDTGSITRNHIESLQEYKLSEAPSRAKRLVQEGDIIYSAVRPNQLHYGYISKFPENLVVSTGFIVISCNKDYIEPKFLYYLLTQQEMTDYLHSIADASTSAYPSLKSSDIENLEISLPSLEEQRRIAGILGAIDDKIENNRRINTNLELQAQALYKQWFVDFEFPNEEGKPYKSSGGKMVDSELGHIPEGWSVGKLEDMGTIVGGGTPSKAKQEYYTSNGIAWITPKDLSIAHAKFTAKGEVDITDIGYANSSAKMMPRGSILFSSRAPIGYISIAKNDICTNQGFKSVVPNNGCTAFVYYFLLSNTENIESKATGSTFKEASGALMKSLELVIPSDDILEKFEKIMSSIFESQEKFEAENETLATLRDTLLPKLMNGEIKL